MIANQMNVERLNTKQFTYICDYLYNETGIVLDSNKTEMVHRRLSKLSKTKGYSSIIDYYEYLIKHPNLEHTDLVNALTTNLTRFFREEHHFDYLKNHYLPRLFEKNKRTKRVRIWSSACSTGEEPYSIAMTLYHHFREYLTTWDVKVLATDIDTNVLAQAKSAIYKRERLQDIPRALQRNCFSKLNDSEIVIAERLRELITFKELNLQNQWPMKGAFDVIFCRNVIIYFDKETQQRLFSRFYDYLAPEGLLILGHSESLAQSAQLYKALGKTVFCKPSGINFDVPR